MMNEIIQEENRRLKEELAMLRQTIIQADPTVMFDGRFEQMITTPVQIIGVAQQLIQSIPQLRYQAETPFLIN
ncbi:MAG: hypothetical protein R3E31_05425 [Chloroflexota bacterium]|nr:hypothetical protein [Anaerolineales bacterium]MCA9974710.1 hypothetical protein [Anaerolineales bacterium]MCB8989186.1 hypothetical protein [Ardenticatenaceae bacterium]